MRVLIECRGRYLEVATVDREDLAPESEQYYELKMLTDDLQARVNLYVSVLTEHGLDLPLAHSLE